MDYIVGGSFASIRRFTEKLGDRGHNIVIITTKEYSDKRIKHSLNRFTTYRFIATPPIGPDRFRSIILTEPALKKILVKNKIDIVYNVFPIPSGFVTVKIAKKLKIPIVAHCHIQAEGIIYVNKTFRPLIYLFYRYLTNFFNKSDHVIFPSKFAQKTYQKHKLKTTSTVISNGIDLTRFKVLPEEKTRYLFKKYKIKKGKTNLIYVGRIAPEKNVETLIRAIPQILSECPKSQFIIIGKGKKVKSFSKWLEKKGIFENVLMLDKVPDEDIAPLLNLGDLFIYPSLLELEGIVLLEAMACGLPLLIANSPSSASPYLLEDNGFTFEARNSGDIATKVIYMIKHPLLLQKMRKQSLKVVPKYNIEKSVDKLEKVFNKLIIIGH